MSSLKNKLLIFFLLLILLPIIALGLFSYRLSSKEIKNSINVSTLHSLDQISKNVDSKIQMLHKYIEVIFSSAQIQEILRDTDFTIHGADYIRSITDLDNFFSALLYKDTENISFLLFDNVNNYYKYNSMPVDIEAFKANSWYNSTLLLNGKIDVIGTIVNPAKYDEDNYVFIMGRVLKDSIYTKDNLSLGTAFIMIDESDIASIYENSSVSKSNELIITDSRGEVISATNDQIIGNNISDASYMDRVLLGNSGYYEIEYNMNTAILAYYTSDFGFKVIQIIDYHSYFMDIRYIGYLTLALCIVCIFFLSILSYFMTLNIFVPIQNLEKAMEMVENGNIDTKIQSISKDEIGNISQRFNSMVIKIKESIQKTLEIERLRKDIEIKTLQQQINPHFLNNTLSSIRLAAMVEGNKNIAKMIEVFSRFLVKTLGNTKSFITIFEEVENIKDFVFIQQLRYNNALTVKYDIDENIHSCMIPSLLLQPLVENAIFHGFDQLSNDLTILIKGFLENKDITIIIQDNGVGMNTNRISEVLSGKYNSPFGSDSIGIINVDNRIKLTYGSEYGLRIESDPGNGVTARVLIPASVMGEERYGEHTNC